MHLREVLPLGRRQRCVDQRQPGGLLVPQVRGELPRELVDDVAEPLVPVVLVRRGGVDGGEQRLDDRVLGLELIGQRGSHAVACHRSAQVRPQQVVFRRVVDDEELLEQLPAQRGRQQLRRVVVRALSEPGDLRERKKLRNRQALAAAALRLFTAKGFDRTTLEELADAADVSKSTFSRIFPAKEAAGIEAEAELWTAFRTVLDERELSGVLFGELHRALADAVAGLDPGWDQRFIDTRHMVANEPALLRYVEHYRAGVKDELVAHLAAKLGLDADDLRLRTLVELTMLAWSVSGRHWVYNDGRGGRKALLSRLDGAIEAIPASLSMSAPA